jgi:hypothetical protein
MSFTRRQFLTLLGGGLLYGTCPNDWDEESRRARAIREHLEAVFADQNMGLDFRCINGSHDEEFRIQIKELDYFPVASAFKSSLILYYYLHTPQAEWNDAEGSTAYSVAVFSSNVETGILLQDVAGRVPGNKNPIEKFNDFLRQTVGMYGGLYTWTWQGNPLIGVTDQRYANMRVWLEEQPYTVDNVFTPADLARTYDILARGEAFSHWDKMTQAIRATRALLSIPASNYQSPIERVWPGGYMGKDGILPTASVSTGYVVVDGGIIQIEDRSYIVAFMSAGENEPAAIDVLREVVGQIEVYEASA